MGFVILSILSQVDPGAVFSSVLVRDEIVCLCRTGKIRISIPRFLVVSTVTIDQSSWEDGYGLLEDGTVAYILNGSFDTLYREDTGPIDIRDQVRLLEEEHSSHVLSDKRELMYRVTRTGLWLLLITRLSKNLFYTILSPESQVIKGRMKACPKDPRFQIRPIGQGIVLHFGLRAIRIYSNGNTEVLKVNSPNIYSESGIIVSVPWTGTWGIRGTFSHPSEVEIDRTEGIYGHNGISIEGSDMFIACGVCGTFLRSSDEPSAQGTDTLTSCGMYPGISVIEAFVPKERLSTKSCVKVN